MASAASYTQANRALKIETSLGEDKLLLRAVSGQEAVSQLFRFQLDLLSEDDSLKLDDIVGMPVTVRLEIADGERFWHGHISRFSQGTRDQRFTNYRAEVVPWLWFLTRTADCRIFQNKTVPDIVQQIFKDLGFSDYKLNLVKSYRTREYCAQYRETDFNFVSRLMEEEGICYFFQHEHGKHTLIMADDTGAHQPCPNQPKARCEFVQGGWAPDDVISEWRIEQEFRPSAWAHTDFNFETPSTSLMVNVQEKPKWEIYDYPGVYPKLADGDKLAKLRLEEMSAFKQRSSGKSNCRNFTTGYTVEVADHYRSDVNQKWLLTAVYHQATMGGSYATGNVEEGMHYFNTFECIPLTTVFRPPRTTPKPHVQGCQTAIVTGPPGEEIFTDKYGRVKVQFFWDREGKKDENSSCWIRVSHPWAGKGWGAVSIPRIGQEVVVDFLEGDPDQPIIMGRVYHAENMPPYGLPAGGVVSGIKSNSTKGGGGYNEMSMNDTKGKEMVTIHAQYDMSTTVEHDDTQTVHNNRTITVDGTQSETVKGAVTETYKNKQTTDVTNERSETVGGAVTENYKNTQTTTVNQAISITSETASIYVHAATSIQLHVGASKLWMASDGNISLEGVNITINGSNCVTIKGQMVHSEADAEHQTKGAVVLSEGSATNTIKGGMVMLNP